MNRLTSASDSLGLEFSSQDVLQAVDSEPAHRRAPGREVDEGLSFFAPVHYERDYGYPLVVWLHDDHGNERQLRQVMPHISMRNYVAAAVRGTQPSRREEHAYVWRQSPEAVRLTAERVYDAIEEAGERFHIRRDRVFIAGHRQGGSMALRLGLRYPEWFAGAISLCGPAPQGDAPLARVNEARDLPLLIASTQDCTLYPGERVAADLRLLHAAGFSLDLRHYPGDCDLTTDMLSDVDRWVMEQFSGSSVIR